LGAETGVDEDGIASLEGGEDFGGGAVAHGFHVDVVGIIVVVYKDVVIATAGGYVESSGLVSVYLASGFTAEDGSVAAVGSGSFMQCCRKCVGVVCVGGSRGLDGVWVVWGVGMCGWCRVRHCGYRV